MAASEPIRDKRAGDQRWIERLLAERWGGVLVAVGGALLDAGRLPALIAGDRQGLATWRRLDASAAELVTLDALIRRQGIGTALLAALIERLQADGVGLLRVTTTNDNLDALRFYQRRGFRITAVLPAQSRLRGGASRQFPCSALTAFRSATRSSSAALWRPEVDRLRPRSAGRGS